MPPFDDLVLEEAVTETQSLILLEDIEIDDGWLLFYGGVLLLIVHAKHDRAEVLNSNNRWVKAGPELYSCCRDIKRTSKNLCFGLMVQRALLLYFGFLFLSSFPVELIIDAVSELTTWNINRSHDIIQENCGTNVVGCRIQRLSPLQLFTRCRLQYFRALLAI